MTALPDSSAPTEPGERMPPPGGIHVLTAEPAARESPARLDETSADGEPVAELPTHRSAAAPQVLLPSERLARLAELTAAELARARTPGELPDRRSPGSRSRP